MFEKIWSAHEVVREPVEVEFEVASVEPMISYGTNPERMDEASAKALRYMGFEPAEAIANRVTDPREFAQWAP